MIFSFSANGEGHISSIEFLSAVIDNNNILYNESAGYMLEVTELIKRHVYKKKASIKHLDELSDFDIKTSPLIVLIEVKGQFNINECVNDVTY